MQVTSASTLPRRMEPGAVVRTTEMHTGGDPFRIVDSGFPQPLGATLLEKRAWLREHADRFRRFIMQEPRGHNDMFGALLVTPDLAAGADLAVIIMHTQGYPTMCGHGTIAVAR